MADKIKAILLKPLNGAEIGSEAEYSAADFSVLEAKGAVKAKPAPQNKMDDAPMNKAAPKHKAKGK